MAGVRNKDVSDVRDNIPLKGPLLTGIMCYAIVLG